MKMGPGLALALLLGLACQPAEPPRLAVRARLVDPAWRVGAESLPPELLTQDLATFPSQTSAAARLPHATIGDDTRPVLAAFAEAPLAYRAPAALDAEGRLDIALAVPAALGDAGALVLLGQLRAEGQETWQALPARLVSPEGEGTGRVVRLAPGTRLGPPGGAVELIAFAVRPAPPAGTAYTTAPLVIPEHAALELSLGLLPAAASEGPVRFTLEACEVERCVALLDEEVDPADPAARAWSERRLDLAALSGTTRRLVFRSRPAAGSRFSLPVFGDPVLLAPAAPDPRPNLVLVSIDTLRRDHLDLYGYPRETAPFLRAFGAEGVVFDDLVAEAATTDPSHMTMFTSLPAEVHGVRRLLEALDVPVTTLAEGLREAGYRTAAFTEDGPLAHDRGFAIGFDAYRENKSPSVMLPTGRVEDTFGQAREWLARNGDRPFFLFLHTFQVHAPYAPPASYRSLFAEPEPAALSAEQRRSVADYDREIRYVDDQLARLVRFADGEGRRADTIWIVLSDHGEAFWEHGLLGHATLPYDEVLRVPLVVRGPGVAAGGRRPDPLHHLDVMPTLLELAGVPAPREAMGRSFAPLLGAGAPAEATLALRPRLSAAWMLPDGVLGPAFALRLGSEKLLLWRDAGGLRAERFELASDPGEQRPGAASQPLLDRLAAARDGAGAVRAGLRGGERAAPGIRLDPEREQMLRELGYIE
jgi:hypothetical protein